MGKIAENKEIKRRAILRAARTVFLEQGYVLASMDRIAEGAAVTKQTVYRYFPSKIELFRACLEHMRESAPKRSSDHLDNPDTEEALTRFAIDFIKAHLADDHLKSIHLLIAESAKAPEITATFDSVGPAAINDRLNRFFAERLGVADPKLPVELWLAMLLTHRSRVLMGRPKPTETEIRDYAKAASRLVMAGLAGIGENAIARGRPM